MSNTVRNTAPRLFLITGVMAAGKSTVAAKLAPALAEVEARHGRLAASLGIEGVAQVRIVLVPLLRPVMGFAAGLAAALSMGNLGVIALFAGEGQATLPLLMARLMGAYRMEAAAGVGLVILALALGLFWLFDRGGRRGAAA